MNQHDPDQKSLPLLQRVLGYLNFSSGKSDPAFLRDLCEVVLQVEPHDGEPTYRHVERLLNEGLETLTSDILQDSNQARIIIQLVFQHILPGYLDFHQGSLVQDAESPCNNPFFLGRKLQ